MAEVEEVEVEEVEEPEEGDELPSDIFEREALRDIREPALRYDAGQELSVDARAQVFASLAIVAAIKEASEALIEALEALEESLINAGDDDEED